MAEGETAMLDMKVLTIDYGVSYGSVTLKSLQNDNVPELDLLVREAIQNSSDASLDPTLPADRGYYTVNFNTGTFNPHSFNALLPQICNIMDSRYSGDVETFLEIRDTGTIGLTGPIRKADLPYDDHGNYFKLIFDTGKKQIINNAGGNWGFGKSVYYRVGMGIVIFYSQIKEDNTYKSRMIFTLVEDENRGDASILGKVDSQAAGKAWWGINDGPDLLPLTENEQIRDVLAIFGIKPFKENETGTSVIIPYINTQELLDGIIPVDADIKPDVRDHFKESYASRLPDYLRLSIQKWYAPKIHNTDLPEYSNYKWLRVAVDNQFIKKQDMIPFFRLTQEMYLCALAKCNGKEYKSAEFKQLKTFPISVLKSFKGSKIVGYLAVARVKKADLYKNGTQLSPYDYVGKYELDGGKNETIMMYARDPGMVIDYATAGEWVKNITDPESEDDFQFGFFVPDTGKEIRDDLEVIEYRNMSLGSYLRECEASDHMSWFDPVRMQIVQRIQINSRKALEEDTNKAKIETIDTTASELAGKLGQALLPKIGYGKKPSGGGPGGGDRGTKIHDVSLEITSQTIIGNETVMDYTLKLSHEKKDASILIKIASEGSSITAANWKEEIGISFPVVFTEGVIQSIKAPTGVIYEDELTVNESEPSLIEDGVVELSMVSETENAMCSRLKYHVLSDNCIISGRIRLRTSDKKYKFVFGLE